MTQNENDERREEPGCCSCDLKLKKMPRLGAGAYARLWVGKLRRAVLGRILTGYTRRQHELRRGECHRCGACCQLGRFCPSLEIDQAGMASCAKYNQKRDPTCRLYPTTESDLRDRDLIMPGKKCGYSFDKRR